MKNFLNKEQKEELLKRHKKEKDGKVRDRIKAIILMTKAGHIDLYQRRY